MISISPLRPPCTPPVTPLKRSLREGVRHLYAAFALCQNAPLSGGLSNEVRLRG